MTSELGSLDFGLGSLDSHWILNATLELGVRFQRPKT